MSAIRVENERGQVRYIAYNEWDSTYWGFRYNPNPEAARIKDWNSITWGDEIVYRFRWCAERKARKRIEAQRKARDSVFKEVR